MTSQRLTLWPLIVTSALLLMFLLAVLQVVFIKKDETPLVAKSNSVWLERQYAYFRLYPLEDRALRLIEEGRLRKAEATLLTARQIESDDPRLLTMLANLSLELGRHHEALRYAKSALAEAPGFTDALLQRALAHQALGDAKNAFADYKTILSLEGMTAQQRRLAQEGVLDTGLTLNRPGAVASYARNFEPPASEQDWRRIAFSLARVGAIDPARELLQDALPTMSSDAERRELLVALGDLERAADNLDTARDRLEEAADVEGTPEVFRRLSALAELSGNLEEAIRWTAKAESWTHEPSDLRRLAMLQVKAGRYDAAGDSFSKLARLRDLDALELDASAMALEKGGVPDKTTGPSDAVPSASAREHDRSRQMDRAARLEEAGKMELRAADQTPGTAPEDRLRRLRAAAEYFRSAGDGVREIAALERVVRHTARTADRLTLAARQAALGQTAAAEKTLRTGARQGDPQVFERYLELLAADPNGLDAVALLQDIAASEDLTRPQRAAVRTQIATMAAAAGDWPVATQLLAEKARANPADPETLRRALYAFGQSNDDEGALRLLRDLHPFAAMPPEARIDFASTLAQRLEQRSGPVAAGKALATVVAGVEGAFGAELQVAEYFSQGKDCSAAIDPAIRAARDLRNRVRALTIAGLCSDALGKDAEARLYLDSAAKAAAGQNQILPPKILKQLAFLYADVERHARAAALFQQSLKQRFEPDIAVVAVRQLRLAGAADEARTLLARINPDDLREPDRRALYYDERVWAAETVDAEQRYLRLALALHETVDRWQRLGNLQRAQGQLDDALASLDRALALAPDNAQLHMERGYASVAAGDDRAAAHHFERAIEIDPHAPVAQDAAYARKRLADNPEAVEHFKDGIDRLNRLLRRGDQKASIADDPAGQSMTASDQATREREALLERRFDLRREVEQLENRWTVTANTTVRLPDDAFGAINPLQRESFSGSGGIEAAYQPPDIGYRNGRTLQAFARAFWNLEDESLVPDAETQQLGFGLRYKPLSDYNAVLSFERLVAAGDLARDDWLARSSISFDHNLDWEPVRDWWPSGTLYLDAARALETNATFLTASGRYGAVFKSDFGSALAGANGVMPYALFVSSYTDEDGTGLSRTEIGVGIALKRWFNETEYEAYRSTAELALEGRVPVAGNTGDEAGVLIRLQMRF